MEKRKLRNLKRKKAYFKKREEENKQIVRDVRTAEKNERSAAESTEKNPTTSQLMKDNSVQSVSVLDKSVTQSTNSTPAAKRACSVLSSNPGPSASQVGAKEGQANKDLQAALLKVMQDQQTMMQAFAQQ